MSFQDTRNWIASTVANDADWTTYPFPPMVPQPNSIVLEPDDPYLTNTNANVSLACRMRLRVRLTVPLFDNSSNLDQLEVMANRVRRLLLEHVWNVGDLSAPQVLDTDNGVLLTAYIPIEVLTEWSTQ